MKKTVRQYLEDLVEYTSRIIDDTSKITESDYSQDIGMQDATLKRIHVLGEVVKRINPDFKNKYADIPWRDIAGMRDVISHDYDGVNMHRAWLIATRDIPKLKM